MIKRKQGIIRKPFKHLSTMSTVTRRGQRSNTESLLTTNPRSRLMTTLKMVSKESTRKNQSKIIHKFLNKATIIKKIINCNRIHVLKRPQLKNLKKFSTLKKSVKTLLDPIRSNSRLRCAGTGSFTKSANSWISALLLMESMSCTRKCTFLQIIRPKYATSSMRRCTVPMETDANFCTPNLTLLTKIRNLTIPRFFQKM